MAVITPLEVSKEDLPITNVNGTVKRRARLFLRYNASAADTYDLRAAVSGVQVEHIGIPTALNPAQAPLSGTAAVYTIYDSAGTSALLFGIAIGTATVVVTVTY